MGYLDCIRSRKGHVFPVCGKGTYMVMPATIIYTHAGAIEIGPHVNPVPLRAANYKTTQR